MGGKAEGLDMLGLKKVCGLWGVAKKRSTCPVEGAITEPDPKGFWFVFSICIFTHTERYVLTISSID